LISVEELAWETLTFDLYTPHLEFAEPQHAFVLFQNVQAMEIFWHGQEAKLAASYGEVTVHCLLQMSMPHQPVS